ncbi:MAG: hypothetical protein KatS3mg005_3995 [Bryobacteraceae bacterium]|nr:MAG: hypothetical protein KatS3mg005_3995 [Bryobacteraceae bacterium]
MAARSRAARAMGRFRRLGTVAFEPPGRSASGCSRAAPFGGGPRGDRLLSAADAASVRSTEPGALLPSIATSNRGRGGCSHRASAMGNPRNMRGKTQLGCSRRPSAAGNQNERAAGDEKVALQETQRSCFSFARWTHGGRRPEKRAAGTTPGAAGGRQQRCGTGSRVQGGHRTGLAVSGSGCNERLQGRACDGSERRYRRRSPGGSGFPILGQRSRRHHRMRHSGACCAAGFTGSITPFSSSGQPTVKAMDGRDDSHP